MISYKDYKDKIADIKHLFYEYRDKYPLFQEHTANLEKTDRFQSRRTVHNIKYSLRLDLTRLVKEFSFFDFSSYWQRKKTHSYSIYTDTNRKICLISVDGGKFKEFWTYIGNNVILTDYLKCENKYVLLSVGKVTVLNEKVYDFTLLEIEKEYALDIDFILKTEQYQYNENNMITEVTTYIYDSKKKITANKDGETELGCIIGKTLYANPEIFKHTLIYDEVGNLSKAFCSNYFSTDKTAELTVVKNNTD